MSPLTSKHVGVFATITVVVAVLLGLIVRRRTALSDEQIYESIQVGMSRAEVENLLGKPADETMGSRVYYGSTPMIEAWQSPVSSHSVSIDYSAENIVKSKHFYPGYNVSVHEP